MASIEINQVATRRTRNSLTKDVILDAAHELAKTGAELSIRNVSLSLGCTPMALYRHFQDKQELLLELLDRIIATVPLGEEEEWEARLIKIASGHLHVLQSNPWAIPLLFEHPDPGPSVRKVGEAMLGALLEAGASSDQAIGAFSSILALNYGWAGFTSITNENAKEKSIVQKLGSPPTAGQGLDVTSGLWDQFQSLGSYDHHTRAIKQLVANLGT